MISPRARLRLGRQPGQIPVGLQPLGYYVAGALPTPPPAVPVPAVAAWGMLGNGAAGDTPAEWPNGVGDCGVAGLQHGMQAAAATTGTTEKWPAAGQAVEYYLGYDKGQDVGVCLSRYLAHVRAGGYYGHTVSAYTHFSPTDVPLLHTVVALWDFAYCGIRVTRAMQERALAGEPWQLADLLSPLAGGHCVPVVAYDDHHLTVVTWGTTQQVTYPAWCCMAEEAWAVMTGELGQGDGRGVAYETLLADLSKLN